MRLVRFEKKVSPYNEGELAGFEDKKAAQLVKDGWASYVIEEKVEEVKQDETVRTFVDNTIRRRRK